MNLELPATGEKAVDIADLCQWLEAEIEYHRQMMSQLADLRQAAVKSMRADGLGYGAIAKRLGVSKGRVQQMANR